MWWSRTVADFSVIPAMLHRTCEFREAQGCARAIAGIQWILRRLGPRLRGDDNRARWAVVAVFVFMAHAIVGCGFHLRGTGSAGILPASLATVRVVMTGTAINEPLAVAVREAIAQAGARVVDTAGTPVLTLSDERVESQVASVRTATAKASEYTLRYTASFRLDGPQPVPSQTIRLQRDYAFDPNSVLAKEQEERELLRDMRRDAAQQIVRRLARAVAVPAL
jgi:LPS-assembly lipoprotein